MAKVICEPLPPHLLAKLRTHVHGLTWTALERKFRLSRLVVTRAASGANINPATRIAIEAELARLETPADRAGEP
jgi:hypothetical protein